MKKVLIVAAVLAFTMSFGFSAFAQEIDCPPCKGYDWEDNQIPCPGDEQANCMAYEIPWCEFVFPICNCPDVDINFAKGARVGIRLTILTEGVYWDRPDLDWVDENDPPNMFDGIEFWAFPSAESACLCDDDDRIDVCDCDVQDTTSEDADAREGEFSQLVFWPDATCDPDEQDDVPSDDFDGECTWSLVDHEKLKVVGTDPTSETAFFTIPNDRDADGNLIPGIPDWSGYSYWMFKTNTVPMIRIDSQEVLAANLRGEPIQIRVQFVKPGDEGICTGDCLVICECIIEVMAICDAEYGCIYFPYVLTQKSPWVTGIALSNVGGNIPVSDMEATFTLTDMAGNEFSYTKDDFENAVWSNVLDNMLDEFDGTPTPGNAFLRIDTNFYADGYQFITDGVFGGSSLPRACDFVCDQGQGCH